MSFLILIENKLKKRVLCKKVSSSLMFVVINIYFLFIVYKYVTLGHNTTITYENYNFIYNFIPFYVKVHSKYM